MTPGSPGPNTFLHWINTSRVKIRLVLKFTNCNPLSKRTIGFFLQEIKFDCYFSVNLDVSDKYIYDASFNDFVMYFFFFFFFLLLLLLFSHISSEPNLIYRIFPSRRSCISTQPRLLCLEELSANYPPPIPLPPPPPPPPAPPTP